MNIPTKFGSNWPSGFREEDSKLTTPILKPSDQQKNFLEDHPYQVLFPIGQVVSEKIKM